MGMLSLSPTISFPTCVFLLASDNSISKYIILKNMNWYMGQCPWQYLRYWHPIWVPLIKYHLPTTSSYLQFYLPSNSRICSLPPLTLAIPLMQSTIISYLDDWMNSWHPNSLFLTLQSFLCISSLFNYVNNLGKYEWIMCFLATNSYIFTNPTEDSVWTLGVICISLHNLLFKSISPIIHLDVPSFAYHRFL